MFTDLEYWLRQPARYERTDAAFWNDPHISAQMLRTHLDPTTDAASRMPGFIDRSVAWIASTLAPGASVLDLGCGPGFYTKQLAARGYAVTGVDISERSLDYARAHDGATHYLHQDYLDLDLDRQFDAVLMIWCDFGALAPDERATVLAHIHRVLHPGGVFVFDVFTRSHAVEETRSWTCHPDGGFWSAEPHLEFSATWHYLPNVFGTRYVIVTEQHIQATNIWNTTFTLPEVTAECEAAGFEASGVYSDVAGAPYAEDSATMAMVLRKPLEID